MKVFYVVDDGYYAAKNIADVEAALVGFHGEKYGKECFQGCCEVILETEMWKRFVDEQADEVYSLYELLGRHVFNNGDATGQLTYDNY